MTNDDGVVISGKIGKFYGLSSELFSGLATSTTGRDSNSVISNLISDPAQFNPRRAGFKSPALCPPIALELPLELMHLLSSHDAF